MKVSNTTLTVIGIGICLFAIVVVSFCFNVLLDKRNSSITTSYTTTISSKDTVYYRNRSSIKDSIFLGDVLYPHEILVARDSIGRLKSEVKFNPKSQCVVHTATINTDTLVVPKITLTVKPTKTVNQIKAEVIQNIKDTIYDIVLTFVLCLTVCLIINFTYFYFFTN